MSPGRTHIVVVLKDEHPEKDASGRGNGEETCKGGFERAHVFKFLFLRRRQGGYSYAQGESFKELMKYHGNQKGCCAIVVSATGGGKNDDGVLKSGPDVIDRVRPITNE